MPGPLTNNASLWSLSTQNGINSLFSTNQSSEEYYEFQIMKNMDSDPPNMDIGKVINMNKYKCHICNVDVPKAYSQEHINSEKHETCKIIADTALERTKYHLSLEPFSTNVSIHINDSYFCEFCVTVVMNNERSVHEVSSHHIASVDHDKMLKQFAAKYVESGSVTRGLAIRDDASDQVAATTLLDGQNVCASPKIEPANVDSHVKNDTQTNAVNDRAIHNANVNDYSDTCQKENDSSRCNTFKSDTNCDQLSEKTYTMSKKKKKRVGNRNKKPDKEMEPPQPNIDKNNIQTTAQLEIKPQTVTDLNIKTEIVQSTPQQLSIEEKPVQNDPPPKLESIVHSNLLSPNIDAKTIQDIPKQSSVETKTIPDLSEQVSAEIKAIPDLPEQVSAETKTIQVLPEQVSTETKTIKDLPETVNVEAKTTHDIPEVGDETKTSIVQEKTNVEKKIVQDTLKQSSVEIKAIQDMPKQVGFETKTVQDVSKQLIVVNIPEQVTPKQPTAEITNVLEDPVQACIGTKTSISKEDYIEKKTVENVPKQVEVENGSILKVSNDVNIEPKIAQDGPNQTDVDKQTNNFEICKNLQDKGTNFNEFKRYYNKKNDRFKQPFMNLKPEQPSVVNNHNTAQKFITNKIGSQHNESLTVHALKSPSTETDIPKLPNVESKTVQYIPETALETKAVHGVLNQHSEQVSSSSTNVNTKPSQQCPQQPNIEKETIQNITNQPNNAAKTELGIPQNDEEAINESEQDNVGKKSVQSKSAKTNVEHVPQQISTAKKAKKLNTQRSVETKTLKDIKLDNNVSPKSVHNAEIKPTYVSSKSNKVDANTVKNVSQQTNNRNETVKHEQKQNAQPKQEVPQQEDTDDKAGTVTNDKGVTITNEKAVTATKDKAVTVSTTSNVPQQNSEKKTVKFATNSSDSTNANQEATLQKPMFKNYGKKKRGKKKCPIYEIKNYIQYAKERCRNKVQFDIEVISERNIIITAANADTVKVLWNHFHGTDKQGVYCKVCQLHNIRDIYHHQQSSTHLDKIMLTLENKHCIRKLDDTWSHCIICNMTYVRRNDDSHVLSLSHIHNLSAAIVNEVNNNEPTPCPGQRRQYCNICREYVVELKTHVSEHKVTPEEKNKLIENSTNSAKVIQQNHLRHMLNDKLHCGICDVRLPTLDLIEHVVSSAHKDKYTEVLQRNYVNEIDCETYYCNTCDHSVNVAHLVRHVACRKHRRMLITKHFDMAASQPLHSIREGSNSDPECQVDLVYHVGATEDSPEERKSEKAEMLASISEESHIGVLDVPVELEKAKPPMEEQPTDLTEIGEDVIAMESAAEVSADAEDAETAEVPAPMKELNRLIGLKMYDCNATPIDPNKIPGEEPVCEECNDKIKDCDYTAHLYSIAHITNHNGYLRYNQCVEFNFHTVNCLACNFVFEIRYLVSHCNSQVHTEKLRLHPGATATVEVVHDKTEMSSQTEVVCGDGDEVGDVKGPLVTANLATPVAHPSTSRKTREFIPKKLFYQFFRVRRTDGLRCIICCDGVTIPFHKIDLINHVNTDTHRHNYDALMNYNRIRRGRLDACHSYYCELCAATVPHFKELSHIHNTKHMDLVAPLFDKDIPRSKAELTFDFAMQQQKRKQRRQALFLRHA